MAKPLLFALSLISASSAFTNNAQKELATGNALDLNTLCHNKLCVFSNVAMEWGLKYKSYKGLSRLAEKYANDLVVIYQPSNSFNQEKNSGWTLKNNINAYFKEQGFTLTSNQYWLERQFVNEGDGPDSETSMLFAKELPKKLKNPGYIRMFKGDKILWNFEKFLFGKKGQPLKRLSSPQAPSGLESYIKEELGLN